MKYFLSQLIGLPIATQNGERIGHVKDLVTSLLYHPITPLVKGVVAKRAVSNKKDFFIPIGDVNNFNAAVHLSTAVVNLSPFEKRGDEALLVSDLLDMQIVDITGKRLTRVNDLEITQIRSKYLLSGVDVSLAAVFSRLKIPKIAHVLMRNVIHWKDVQFLGGHKPLQIKLSYANLESLPTKDIARVILEGPGYRRAAEVIKSLDRSIAANVVMDLSIQYQVPIIESLKISDAVHIIQRLPTYKTARIIARLKNEVAQKLLSHLPAKKVSIIKRIISYPEDSVGAHMSSDFIVLPAQIAVGDALDRLHDFTYRVHFPYYVYILEDEKTQKLIGVTSEHELITADRRVRLANIMHKNVIVGRPKEKITDIIKKMTHYNLSAVPIVNNHMEILGVVTVTDAILPVIAKKI